MAVGDDATEAGLELVPDTAQVRYGAREINRTRDFIAQIKTQLLNSIWTISKGGTGATTAEDARTNLGVSAIGHTHDDRYFTQAEITTKIGQAGEFAMYQDTLQSATLQNMMVMNGVTAGHMYLRWDADTSHLVVGVPGYGEHEIAMT